VWALGVLLYELLAGQRPFTGKTVDQLEEAILHAEPPPIRKEAVDGQLLAIVNRCLAKKPSERYQTAHDLADDLRRWLDKTDEPRRPEWRRLVFAASMLLALGFTAALTLLVLRDRGHHDDPDQAQLATIHGQLEQKQAVPWLTAEGKPLRAHWIEGAGGLESLPDDGGTLRVTTQDSMALLELLPAVQRDRYRLAFHLKMEPGPGGRAGFYCLHEIAPTTLGPRHLFLSVSLADEGFFAGQFRVEFESYHLKEADHRAMPKGSGTFQPVPQGWHRVEVVVRPEYLQLYLDGKMMGEQRQDDLDFIVKHIRQDNDERALDAALPIPSFNRGGGFGLYANNTTAWYRDVFLTPE
jgi:hypothetical protein